MSTTIRCPEEGSAILTLDWTRMVPLTCVCPSTRCHDYAVAMAPATNLIRCPLHPHRFLELLPCLMATRPAPLRLPPGQTPRYANSGPRAEQTVRCPCLHPATGSAMQSDLRHGRRRHAHRLDGFQSPRPGQLGPLQRPGHPTRRAAVAPSRVGHIMPSCRLPLPHGPEVCLRPNGSQQQVDAAAHEGRAPLVQPRGAGFLTLHPNSHPVQRRLHPRFCPPVPR